MTDFHTLTVSQIQNETTDAVSISFAVPETLKDTFTYTQGQYLTLRSQVRGEEVRRAYSMSSSPLDEDLTVTVKRVRGGLMSNYLLDHMKVGATLEVMPPQGRFHTPLDAAQRKTYYLFGAGSGITPLMSIIRTALEQEPQSQLFLLYGNRSEETIIFKEKLDELQKRYEGQLFVEHILSQPKKEKAGGLGGLFKKATTNWQGKTGRIDRQTVTDFLAQNVAKTKENIYFVCGPEGMMNAVSATLEQRGVDKKSVHSEHFISHPVAPKAATAGEIAVEGATLTAKLNGKTVTVQVSKKQTLLDALLAQKIEAPYSCTSGACSTCMAKIVTGTVKMDNCFALDDDEVLNGYILTCQAHPTSASVEINYDA
jgi:ring-1,2-phenylacetyl-CoA epoxidase subunit PaaE